MNGEIIGVGTELLLGQIANTNAQTISRALATIGVGVYYQTAVGDNPERMTQVIRHALDRSDVAIVTGGLGPTPDDITREAIAAATGRKLVRDQKLETQIRSIFERLGRAMPEENLKQADLPDGGVPFPPVGTAPGFYLDHDSSLIIALPGVPWEMEAMLTEHVLPLLRARSGAATIVTREILVIGLGESHTHAKIADIVEAQTNPTIAFLAGGGQVRVRLTAKAPDERGAHELIRPVEEKILERLGESAARGEGGTIAQVLGNMLQDRGETLAVAESLTGGLIGAELTRAEGSSEFFLGSVVAYATESKRDVVGVDEELLEKHGAVSDEAAAALAEGAARIFRASLGLSATGVAGPVEQEGEPVGTLFVGASYKGKTEVRKVRGYGDRSNVRAMAVTFALDHGRRMLERNA